jgi:hypothetical protein
MAFNQPFILNERVNMEDIFGNGHIDISDDENFVDNDGGDSQRGKKRQKGMKVGPKVIFNQGASQVQKFGITLRWFQ